MKTVPASQVNVLIGRRLRAAREISSVGTARDLAIKIGIKEDRLTTYERGARGINRQLLPAISRALGVSAEFILTGNLAREAHDIAEKLKEKVPDAIFVMPLTDDPAQDAAEPRSVLAAVRRVEDLNLKLNEKLDKLVVAVDDIARTMANTGDVRVDELVRAIKREISASHVDQD